MMESEERHDVLCGCGWGLLAVRESVIPANCPMCGYQFIPDEKED
jgi:predicted RNA-binding Zn-ribbon protein involved in translation (DUF1610 family)